MSIAERIAQDGQGFDQLNGEGGGTFTWDAGVRAWRARTQGQQAGQKEPFARGVIRTDQLAENDTVWAGVEFLIPSSFYANVTKWQDGPLRGINWREYPGTKDNTGLSLAFGFAGATGALEFASWRDVQQGSKRLHAREGRPSPDVWHIAEIEQHLSRSKPYSVLHYDGRETTPSISSVYDWSRPFVLNDWQFGLVGTSGNPAPLEMLVRRAYVGPRQLFTSSPEPAPDRAAILADARAHMKLTSITYKTWLARKQAGYYKNPDATEWAKADALLDQLK